MAPTKTGSRPDKADATKDRQVYSAGNGDSSDDLEYHFEQVVKKVKKVQEPTKKSKELVADLTEQVETLTHENQHLKSALNEKRQTEGRSTVENAWQQIQLAAQHIANVVQRATPGECGNIRLANESFMKGLVIQVNAPKFKSIQVRGRLNKVPAELRRSKSVISGMMYGSLCFKGIVGHVVNDNAGGEVESPGGRGKKAREAKRSREAGEESEAEDEPKRR